MIKVANIPNNIYSSCWSSFSPDPTVELFLDLLSSRGWFTRSLLLALPHPYCSGMLEDLRALCSVYQGYLSSTAFRTSNTTCWCLTPMHLIHMSQNISAIIHFKPLLVPSLHPTPRAFLPGLVKIITISSNRNIVLPLAQVTTQKVSLPPFNISSRKWLLCIISAAGCYLIPNSTILHQGWSLSSWEGLYWLGIHLVVGPLVSMYKTPNLTLPTEEEEEEEEPCFCSCHLGSLLKYTAPYNFIHCKLETIALLFKPADTQGWDLVHLSSWWSPSLLFLCSLSWPCCFLKPPSRLLLGIFPLTGLSSCYPFHVVLCLY